MQNWTVADELSRRREEARTLSNWIHEQRDVAVQSLHSVWVTAATGNHDAQEQLIIASENVIEFFGGAIAWQLLLEADELNECWMAKAREHLQREMAREHAGEVSL